MPQTADINEAAELEPANRDEHAIPDQPPPVNPEILAMYADAAWINDQYNDGALDDYTGEYIGVVEKKVLGHGKIVQTVREEVAAAIGCRVGRVVTRFIDRGMYC